MIPRFLIPLFLLLSLQGWGQTTMQIDSLVYRIERTIFRDTIQIDLNENSPCKSIVGYANDDTIMKVDILKKNGETIVLYYWYHSSLYSQLVRSNEINGTREQKYSFIGDTIIFNSSKHSKYENDSLAYLEDEYFEFYYLVEEKIIDNQAEHYTFLGKLIEIPKGIRSCGGIIPSGAAFKYEVIETTFKNYSNKYVIIYTACPSLYGKNFFNANQSYTIYAATNNGASFGIKILNDYINEGIPTFWSRTIERKE